MSTVPSYKHTVTSLTYVVPVVLFILNLISFHAIGKINIIHKGLMLNLECGDGTVDCFVDSIRQELITY